MKGDGKVEKLFAVLDWVVALIRWLISVIKSFPKPPDGVVGNKQSGSSGQKD